VSCPSKPYDDPAFLHVAYWQREQSLAAIADSCGVSSHTIISRFRKHDITTRSAASPKRSKEAYITDLQRVDGLVEGVVSVTDYVRLGEYSHGGLHKRFDCEWVDVLKEADIYHNESLG